MSEPKTEEKITIVERRISLVENTIYDETINSQVGKMAKDKDMVKIAEDAFQKNEKVIYKYLLH